MKRFLAFVAAILLALTFVAPIARADTNNFSISSFEADYYLDRDTDGRSTLKTVERITAEFPDFDQNHGIERAIPEKYDGHPTDLTIRSVTNAEGSGLNYSTYESNDNVVLRIGDADRYVHGQQVYVITYLQRDVTRYFSDTNDDELYWDVNGTQWQQQFGKVTARLHLTAELAGKLTHRMSCYQGVQDSSERCDIETSADGQLITAQSTRPLGATENITFAVGFAPHSFAAYQRSIWEWLGYIWGIVAPLINVLAFVLAVGGFWRWARARNRTGEIGTVVPEYLPPKEASVTLASEVLSAKLNVMTAQLLDLAVRHYLKLYQTREKSFFRPAEYEIEIIKDLSDLRWEEQELLKDMFDNQVSVGTRLNLKTLRNNTSFYRRTLNNDTDLQKLIRGQYALRIKDPVRGKWFKYVGAAAMIIGVLSFSIFMFLVGLVMFIMGSFLWPLTDKGLELRRYLEGLKLYIKVAEQERIKMLQSPDGVVKVGASVDGNDPRELIKLYERVLPYAVLFGQEKQWAKQLGAYYENIGAQPDWYSGNSAMFNAAVFSSAMSGLSTTTGYTSSSSSSSGGSSGGGSSGGGGGGGGGGGW